MEAEYHCSEEYTKQIYDLIDSEPTLDKLRLSDVRICGVSSTKKKRRGSKIILGECRKVPAIEKAFTPFDFEIIIYEPNCAGLSEIQFRILLWHELLHVGIHEKNNGTTDYYIVPHDQEEFNVIIEKYGLDWAETGKLVSIRSAAGTA